MQQNKSFILREIENVPYLLPYGQMIADHMHGMKINATGSYLWKLLEQERTINELLSLSAAYYDISEEEMPEFQADITQFLKQLIAYGIIADSETAYGLEHMDEMLLSIGGLGIHLTGPADAFPKELTPFVTTDCTQIHQHIELCIGMPPITQNGQVLLRNEELIVLEQEEQYILLFPHAKQIVEIHLKKDACHARCYCLPPYSETFHYDLFHALRLIYLYLAQRHGMVALHSASILYQNKAWLFSGRSGMGKSTHTNLWKALYQTPLINGDLNLLAILNGQAVVLGIPWCGTSETFDTKTYPLGGIILLNQAPTDSVEELAADKQQLFVCQRLISPTWTAKLFDINLKIIKEISKKIIICRLHCTKENNAAETMKAYIDNV